MVVRPISRSIRVERRWPVTLFSTTAVHRYSTRRIFLSFAPRLAFRCFGLGTCDGNKSFRTSPPVLLSFRRPPSCRRSRRRGKQPFKWNYLPLPTRASHFLGKVLTTSSPNSVYFAF